MRRSKILATLGPASTSPAGIEALVLAGADAFRINASHLSPSEVAAAVALVKHVLSSLPYHIPVVVDLQGPKLRLVSLPEPVVLEPGSLEEVSFPGHAAGPVSLAFDPFAVGLEVGHRVLFHDGRVEAFVECASYPSMSLRFPSGGVLESRKGVNLPDTDVAAPALTDDDRLVVEAGMKAGCEWFALSFVQSSSDIDALRDLIGPDTGIIAKIERPTAMRNLSVIAEHADALLVARGDLGVELPFEEVPLAQREVWDIARRMGRPVICATEMLESMISSPRPTRAEATDVSSAVLDAFDCLMLSAETAAGHDPVGAVSAMRRIGAAVESSPRFEERLLRYTLFQDAHPEKSAVAASAVRLARDTRASAIIALTASGFTASLLAACRPNVPVVAVTPSSRTAARMNLLWGVTPLVSPRSSSVEQSGRDATAAAVVAGLVEPGSKVVVCGSRVGPTSDADAIWVQRA